MTTARVVDVRRTVARMISDAWEANRTGQPRKAEAYLAEASITAALLIAEQLAELSDRFADNTITAVMDTSGDPQ